jgi:hypothetical protein
MKHLFSFVLLTASLNATAQIYIPPDPYNDSERDSYGMATFNDLYDAEGRLVVQQRISSHADRSDDLFLGDQGSALYVIVVDAAKVAKWVPIR